ncbi:Separase [Arachis hypogaea]|nr:Separase [Arachis hypogaea]
METEFFYKINFTFGVSQPAAATDSVFLFYGSNFSGFEGPFMVDVEWEALEFLCSPLANSVNSERKQLVTEEDDASAITMLPTVRDAFYILCQILLSSLNFTYEKNTEEFEENRNTLLAVALATFTLSIRTNLKLQESTRLVKQMMASKWIHWKGIIYMTVALKNIYGGLYRNKQLNEAYKVLNLCCKESWTCIKGYCAFLTKGDLKEFGILTYERSVDLLNHLYQVNSLKFRKKVIKILTNWSTTKNMVQDLPTPIPVLELWVQIECQQAKQVDEGVDSLTLYSLLSSSTKFSKRNISIMLEQVQRKKIGRRGKRGNGDGAVGVTTTSPPLCRHRGSERATHKPVREEDVVAAAPCRYQLGGRRSAFHQGRSAAVRRGRESKRPRGSERDRSCERGEVTNEAAAVVTVSHRH